MRSEVKNSWPKYGNLRNRQNCLIFRAILSIFDTKSVFSTFYTLGKSLGPLRDLTESSMQNNLRFNKNLLEIISEEIKAKLRNTRKSYIYVSFWTILVKNPTYFCVLTFDVLEKSHGALRDLTEVPQEKNLRVIKFFN